MDRGAEKVNLKIDQSRYKVFIEESYAVETDSEARAEKWRYYELRGSLGDIYPYSISHLCVLIRSNRVGEKTRRLKPAWKLIQNGDDEMVFLLPNEELEQAALIVHPRKRRFMTEEQKARAAERLRRFQFPGRAVEVPENSEEGT